MLFAIRKSKSHFSIQDLTIMALFLALLILGAYMRIPLGFMTVTLQLVFANMAGLILGAKRSFLVCMTYLMMGLIGLPVFSGGAGPFYVLHPTFGYIVGFTIAVFISGLLFKDRQCISLKNALLFTLLTSLICYAIGAVHYHIILNIYLSGESSLRETLIWAVLATLPKDLILGGLGSVAAVRIKRAAHLARVTT